LKPSTLYTAVALVSRPFVRAVLRTRWLGAENVPPSGGAVLAANHLSNFDAWPLAIGLFPRYLRFMAKEELFWPPLGYALRALGGFRVRRGRGDREALSTAVTLCREGNVVAVFPEGTRRGRRRADAEAQAFTGAARIALRADVPLIPVAISGTDRLSRLGPVSVAYGAPIRVDDVAGVDRRAAARLATSRLMEEIARLEASIRRPRA
jgi:1-acyl-sn-glycerol-3-phosphate acyltransferase